MSPLIDLEAVEMAYKGDIESDDKRGISAKNARMTWTNISLAN